MRNKKPVNKSSLKNIRQMHRNNPTPWEWKLWQYLRNRQIDSHKFRRQASIGNFVVDFCCLELRLIIEVDGSGHMNPQQQASDIQRTMKLEEAGYTVLRFYNHEIDENLEEVLHAIKRKCKELEASIY